jgi:hypothetical protein
MAEGVDRISAGRKSSNKVMRAIFFAALIASQATGGSVSGFVTNSVTGAGIGDALVIVWTAQQGAVQQAVTDDVGAYHIAGIPDGQYMVEPSKDGFFRADLGRPEPPVRISGEARFDLKLMQGASVRGRVLDPEGKPAAAVAMRLGPFDGQVTDEKGEFAFKEVTPGSYILSATPKPRASAKDGEKIVTTLYPSAVAEGQAVPIKVEGADLSGYDIRLQTASAHSVRGVVINTDGKPAPHAKVSVFKPASERMTTVHGSWSVMDVPRLVEAAEPVETGEDGGFAFPQVVDGDWRVQAVLPSANGLPGCGATEVRISKRDIDDLEIRLAEPIEIEVSADWGDPPPQNPPPAPVLGILPFDGEKGIPQPGRPQRLQYFAGRYFIGHGFGQTPGYYLAAVMLGNRDVLGQVVELSGATSLKMIYKTDGGSLRGTVENGMGAMVVLMAEETPASRHGYGAKCDANGGFVIPDIPPGEYTLLAFPDPRVLTSPDFPSLLVENGKRFTVEAGASAQVDLKLMRQQ